MTNTPPSIEIGQDKVGKRWARVKNGTGIAVVRRSYTAIKAGDQGTGGADGFYPGKHVYITPKLAAGLNAHEKGHIAAVKKVYDQTLKEAVDKAARYRNDKTYANADESDDQLSARLLGVLKWDQAIKNFHAQDILVNNGSVDIPGSFHAWEKLQGGGPSPFEAAGMSSGDIDSVHYDLVLKSREETEPSYHLPDYGTYTPPPLP
jgi:hypothetical protein